MQGKQNGKWSGNKWSFKLHFVQETGKLTRVRRFRVSFVSIFDLPLEEEEEEEGICEGNVESFHWL